MAAEAVQEIDPAIEVLINTTKPRSKSFELFIVKPGKKGKYCILICYDNHIEYIFWSTPLIFKSVFVVMYKSFIDFLESLSGKNL